MLLLSQPLAGTACPPTRDHCRVSELRAPCCCLLKAMLEQKAELSAAERTEILHTVRENLRISCVA